MLRPTDWLATLFVLLGLSVTTIVSATDENPLERYGLKPTEEDVRKVLAGFKQSETQLAHIRALIAQLNSKSFQKREAATVELYKLPIMPHQLLEEAAKSDVAEIRTRARMLLEKRPVRVDESTAHLRAVLRTITQVKLKGFAADLLPLLSRLRLDTDWKPVAEALRTTATSNDLEALRKALASDLPIVRAAAARALQAVAGKSAIGSITPLYEDADLRVQLAAARAMGDLGERSSLAVLANLMTSPQWQVRHEASLTLRSLTGKKFGYLPYGPLKEQTAAIAKWKNWIDQHAATATLKFPVTIINSNINLFSNSDLTGWKVFRNGALHDGRGDKTTCTFHNDGVVTVNAKANGYLRTAQAYTNFRLSLEYRWPEGDNNGDSGIQLFHTIDDVENPGGLEVQMHNRNAGDFYSLGAFRVAPGGKLPIGINSRLAPSSEKPIGKWNRLEIALYDGIVTVKVNGVLQNRATGCPKKPEHIGLRLERSTFDLQNVVLSFQND